VIIGRWEWWCAWTYSLKVHQSRVSSFKCTLLPENIQHVNAWSMCKECVATQSICINMFKVKVKLSLFWSGQALRVPGGWGSQISRHGGKVVSPVHRLLPPHPQGSSPGTHLY
jgi:hypothetical protein